MKIYSYDPETFELTGERDARPDPREPGRYLVPRYAVTVVPPATRPNEAARWSVASNRWEVVPDWRGVTYYDKGTGLRVRFDLGESPGEDVTTTAPDPGRMQEWDAEANAWVDTAEQVRADERAAAEAAGYPVPGRGWALAIGKEDVALLGQYDQVLSQAVQRGAKALGDPAKLKDKDGRVHELTVQEVLEILTGYGLFVMELYWMQQETGGAA